MNKISIKFRHSAILYCSLTVLLLISTMSLMTMQKIDFENQLDSEHLEYFKCIKDANRINSEFKETFTEVFCNPIEASINDQSITVEKAFELKDDFVASGLIFLAIVLSILALIYLSTFLIKFEK